MDKTNQLFLNLPNGTFLFLRVEALINFVLCVASQKEKWLGDRISLFHCPSLNFVTVLRCPANVWLAYSHCRTSFQAFSLLTFLQQSNKFFKNAQQLHPISLIDAANPEFFMLLQKARWSLGSWGVSVNTLSELPAWLAVVILNLIIRRNISRKQDERMGCGSRRKE